MSATFSAAAKALNDNPQLLAKMQTAGSAEERVAIFKSAGITVPTHADVNTHLAKMAGVAGGATSPSLGDPPSQDDIDTTIEVGGGVAAAAGAGAA
jgi:hypothetical protein